MLPRFRCRFQLIDACSVAPPAMVTVGWTAASRFQWLSVRFQSVALVNRAVAPGQDRAGARPTNMAMDAAVKSDTTTVSAGVPGVPATAVARAR